MLASGAAAAIDKTIKQGRGMVFGQAAIESGPRLGYRLYLREVDTGKREGIPLDPLRAGGEEFRFGKNVKPGRYFLETAISPAVGWENRLTDRRQFFDVGEVEAVYLGKWNLWLTVDQSRYEVSYPDHAARSVLADIRNVDTERVRKGVFGGFNESYDPGNTALPGNKAISREPTTQQKVD